MTSKKCLKDEFSVNQREREERKTQIFCRRVVCGVVIIPQRFKVYTMLRELKIFNQ